jgi:hypothetical protein
MRRFIGIAAYVAAHPGANDKIIQGVVGKAGDGARGERRVIVRSRPNGALVVIGIPLDALIDAITIGGRVVWVPRQGDLCGPGENGLKKNNDQYNKAQPPVVDQPIAGAAVAGWMWVVCSCSSRTIGKVMHYSLL